MNTSIWIVQIVLALIFSMSGLMKVLRAVDALAAQMGWVHDVPPRFVRIIGILELLAVAGLILPSLTGIAPRLTPLAACGLSLTMLVATGLHARRKEPQFVALTVFLLALALFVVYGRFVTDPL